MKRRTLLLTMLTGLMMALPATAIDAGGRLERGTAGDRLPTQLAVIPQTIGGAQFSHGAQIELIGRRGFRGHRLRRGGFGHHRGFSRHYRSFNRRHRDRGFGHRRGFSNYYGRRGSFYGFDRHYRGHRGHRFYRK